MVVPYQTAMRDQERNVTCHSSKLTPNPLTSDGFVASLLMELNDTRNRAKRKMPNFMYGDTFPRDAVGSGGASFGGALEWLHKHQDYLNQSLRYVQRYPNLVQDKVLDSFWDFMEPLVHNSNLLVKYDEFLRTQFGFNEQCELENKFTQRLPTASNYFKADIDTRRGDYNYPLRRSFFCYDRTSSHHQNLKHLIVDQLEPFVSVRTNPSAEQAKVVSSLDVCRAICGGVFIMLLNDNLLRDTICLNLLSIAIAYKTPIIFLRESGYSLPDDIQESKIIFVKVPENAPFHPKSGTFADNSSRVKSSPFREQKKIHTTEPESEDIGVTTLKTQEQEEMDRIRDTQLSTNLATKIRELYAESLVFNADMFETTLAALYDKVASYTGASFPGEIPKLAVEAAANLCKPHNLGAMKMPERRVYKVGTARTTRGFLSPTQEGAQLQPGLNTTNNNNSSGGGANDTTEECKPDPLQQLADMSIEVRGQSLDEQNECLTDNQTEYSHQLHRLKQARRQQEFPTSPRRGTDRPCQQQGAPAMVPTPPKVMRISNLQGQLIDLNRTNGFRPNYPCNARLLKYRPGSGCPASARSAVRTRALLHASIQRDAADMECT